MLYAKEIVQEIVQKAKEVLIGRQDTHLDSLAEKLQEPRIKAIIEPILAGLELGNVPWYDSLATLAELRQKHPDDAALKNDWQSLLESVNLAEIAQEPLIGELKPN